MVEVADGGGGGWRMVVDGGGGLDPFVVFDVDPEVCFFFVDRVDGDELDVGIERPGRRGGEEGSGGWRRADERAAGVSRVILVSCVSKTARYPQHSKQSQER